MKILMISKSGDGFGIAQKLQAEDHDIRVWVKEKGFEYGLSGIIQQVSSWRSSASNWADLVISDMVGFGAFATQLDSMKVSYIGFNPIADLMELDRAKQMELFRRFSILIPPTEEFSTPGQAKSILNNWIPPGYVIKPSGNLDTGRTYVVKDPDIYEWALDQFSGDQDMIVQEIVDGVEISTEGWFNGKEWLEPFNHTIEYKRFLPGDLGPNTGCMGNVVWAADSKSELVKNVKKLTPFLRAADYRGPIDLNTIVNASGIYALEVTARLGYDAIEALYEIFENPILARLFESLAKGRKTNALDLAEIPIKKDLFGIAVRLTVPPYPYDEANKSDRGMPIKGIPKNLAHIYPTDIFYNNNQFKWAASDGVLMKVGESGKSIEQARNKVYSIVDNIITEGLMYRKDIGIDVSEKIKKLRALGVL